MQVDAGPTEVKSWTESVDFLPDELLSLIGKKYDALDFVKVTEQHVIGLVKVREYADSVIDLKQRQLVVSDEGRYVDYESQAIDTYVIPRGAMVYPCKPPKDEKVGSVYIPNVIYDDHRLAQLSIAKGGGGGFSVKVTRYQSNGVRAVVRHGDTYTVV